MRPLLQSFQKLKVIHSLHIHRRLPVSERETQDSAWKPVPASDQSRLRK
jgi:hypothetical protein